MGFGGGGDWLVANKLPLFWNSRAHKNLKIF